MKVLLKPLLLALLLLAMTVSQAVAEHTVNRVQFNTQDHKLRIYQLPARDWLGRARGTADWKETTHLEFKVGSSGMFYIEVIGCEDVSVVAKINRTTNDGTKIALDNQELSQPGIIAFQTLANSIYTVDLFTKNRSGDTKLNKVNALTVKTRYGTSAFRADAGFGFSVDRLTNPQFSIQNGRVVQTGKDDFATRAVIYTHVVFDERVTKTVLDLTPFAAVKLLGFNSETARFGLSVGTDVATNNEAGQTLMVGLSMFLGESQQVGLTFGYNFGSEQRLNGINVGDQFTGSADQLPLRTVRRVKPFVGLTIKL